MKRLLLEDALFKLRDNKIYYRIEWGPFKQDKIIINLYSQNEGDITIVVNNEHELSSMLVDILKAKFKRNEFVKNLI